MIENCFLGIEFGSTRIKAVLINEQRKPICTGSFTWTSTMKNGYFTYSTEEIINGLQKAYADLAENIKTQFGENITSVKAMCISAMMHGFLPFDKNMNLLTDFRTWQNVNTEKAANELSEKLNFNMPLRWSAAHLYQAAIDRENYINDIDFVTTLAGYVHFLLTGEKCLGVGDASGMFPIKNYAYDENRAVIYDNLLREQGLTAGINTLFPTIKNAGEPAGKLTESGALLLDPTGKLKHGIPFAPPEGDAGTGMTATNSVKVRTGNISAGTSVFAMAVLDRELANCYPEIDMVTTPDGAPVAMVHCNNCSGEIDAWVAFLADALKHLEITADMKTLYDTFFNASKDGDVSGIMTYGFRSAEPIAGVKEPISAFLRTNDSGYSLANVSKSVLMSALTTLAIGMEKLTLEGVTLEKFYGHGGYFKARGVGAQIAADALHVPVATVTSVGEGGAYGAALLAAYMEYSKISLSDFLSDKVFNDVSEDLYTPKNTNDFSNYLSRFKDGLKNLK